MRGFDGRDVGFRVRVGCGFRRGLLSGFGGAGEHLNDLFEGGGVSLDEGGRVRVGGFGSGVGFRGLGSWGCRGSSAVEVVVAVRAACAAVGAVAVWGGKQIRSCVIRLLVPG